LVRNTVEVEIRGPEEKDVQIGVRDGESYLAPDGLIEISRKGLNGRADSVSLKILDPEYTGVEWYINGGLKGTGAEYSIQAASYPVMNIELSVLVYIGQVPYSHTFTVQVGE
jgi:hypothetical protein